MLVVYACYNRSCKVSYPSQELFLPTCTCQQNVQGSAREFATFWSCGMWAVSKVCSQQVLELLLLVLRPSQSPLTRSFQLCVFAANYDRVHHFQVQNLPSVWIFFLSLNYRTSFKQSKTPQSGPNVQICRLGLLSNQQPSWETLNTILKTRLALPECVVVTSGFLLLADCRSRACSIKRVKSSKHCKPRI